MICYVLLLYPTQAIKCHTMNPKNITRTKSQFIQSVKKKNGCKKLTLRFPQESPYFLGVKNKKVKAPAPFYFEFGAFLPKE